MAPRSSRLDHAAVLRRAWTELGDPRRLLQVTEASAKVSTNRVYRLDLDDDSRLYSKVSNYGSYFLFAEDHDRIHRWRNLLQPTRYRDLLARSLTRDDKVVTYYDGDVWAVFYDEVPLGQRLPRILDDRQISNLAQEMALFHLVSSTVAPAIPLTSKSVKSDAINMLDLLSNPYSASRFGFDPDELSTARHHCHEFLMTLDRLGYDDIAKVPVLIDWNLGNFSVAADGDRFRLFSRWDYDWFRIEPRSLDFYFLSRVSSQTGDRTRFTYSAHTLLEPRFMKFVRAYHEITPLTEAEIELIGESYRFFILNYVLREGDGFFRRQYWQRFQREAVREYLPDYERLDLSPLKEAVLG